MARKQNKTSSDRSSSESSSGKGTPEGEVEVTARWVNQGSSEFRRMSGTDDPSTSTFVREKANNFRKLSALEKKRAFQTLVLEPDERAAPRERDAVSMLVAWTYSSDLFHGLNEKQRRAIVLEVEQEDYPEDDSKYTSATVPCD